jgi:LmbE family N-acetylglucosaminyl deacetylase
MTVIATSRRTTPGRSDVEALGTIVGVWAHPDDEAYLSAGLMAAAVELGSRVVCVTATRGELGTDDPETWPPARLAARRERELAASLSALGVHDHRWLDYPDGALAGVPEAVGVAAVRSVLDRVRPDTVVTFGPDGLTGHPDHMAISRWATTAARQVDAQVLHATTTAEWVDRFAEVNERFGIFGADGPPRTPAEDTAVDLVLPARLAGRKFAALRAHASQTSPLVHAVGAGFYRSWWARESFVTG